MSTILDTVPGDFTSSAELFLNQTTVSALDFSGDVDVFRIDLTSGTYEISATRDGAAPLLDSSLRLFDSNGLLVAGDEDSGLAFDALIETELDAGSYFVEIASRPSPLTGTYALTVSDGGAAQSSATATSEIFDALDWGVSVETDVVDVYFAQAGERFDGVVSEGWTSYEIERALAALDTIAEVSGLTFRHVNRPENAEFKLVVNTDIPGFGYFHPDDSLGERGVGVFNRDFEGWEGGLHEGGFGFYGLIHEFLHGLGFAHPHDEGGQSSILDGLSNAFDTGPYGLNQGAFTVLSFNTGWDGVSGDYDPFSGHAAGPGALDIALLQQKYGANSQTGAGDTVYTLTDDAISYQAIWDTNGTDTLAYNGTGDAILDLRAATIENEQGGGGFISYIEGIDAGFTIAQNTLIENATGGAGDDSITGNDGANLLIGGGGDDRFTGGAGADTIEGGAGNGDTAVYSGARADYTVTDRSDGTYTVHGADDGGDTLSGVEYLAFSDGIFQLNTIVSNRVVTEADGDRRTTIFNDNGIRESLTFEDGSNTRRWESYTNTYDETGIRTDQEFIFDNGDVSNRTFASGALQTNIRIEADGDVRTATFNSNEVRESFVFEDGSNTRRWESNITTYDETGIRTDQDFIFDNGDVSNRTFTNGTISTNIINEADGDVRTITYNSNGVRESLVFLDGSDTRSWASYINTYDENGHLIEREFSYDLA